jgi:hypothetical protein
MVQLTTYRVKHKLNGLVFLFKFDLNGDLRWFGIPDEIMNNEQMDWLYSNKFPRQESYMDKWKTDPKYTKQFEVEKSPADVSFEALWNLYDYKVSRMDSENKFKKLKPAEVIKCFIEIPYYLDTLKKTPGIGKLHLATYIHKRRFEDERPQVAMKVGKVFNPMLKNLASKMKNK